MYKIAAGIVTYNPNINQLNNNIFAIYNQVEIIVIVDNGSVNFNLVRNKFEKYIKIIFIENKNNFGIAKALNQIMDYCLVRNFDWVLTLDQDSICPVNIIDEYMKYINLSKVAIISPNIIDRNRQNKGNIVFDNNFDKVEKCITSGAMTNIKVWNSVGGFDELLFIDLVDFEYSQRCNSLGYFIIRVNNIFLEHEIGHITQHKFFLFNCEVKNHIAFRKYYMVRNLIYCSTKKYMYKSSFFAYLSILKIFILTIFFEDNKLEKIKKMLRGMHDGILLLKK